MKGLPSSTLDPHSVGPEAIQIAAARCAIETTETVTFLRENIEVCFHGMLEYNFEAWGRICCSLA